MKIFRQNADMTDCKLVRFSPVVKNQPSPTTSLILQYFIKFISVFLTCNSICFAFDKLPSNLIEQQFPQVNNCTPTNLYYDKETKKSNNVLLEARGYSAYKIDNFSAYYRVNEKFFGLRAYELSIPSNTDSLYTVKVNSNVEVLQESLKKSTGVKLNIYRKGYKPQSGIAYLIDDGEKKSTFVCFTFEE